MSLDFDCVIMNPPYDGNTHLKILDNVITEFPNAEIVNLSPIRWIADPLAEYKKNSDFNRFKNIHSHIAELDKIDKVDAQRQMSISNLTDLGIYKLTNECHDYTAHKNKIVDKIIETSKDFFKGHYGYTHEDFGVILHIFVGGSGRHFDGGFTGEILNNGFTSDGRDYSIRSFQCSNWNDKRKYLTANFKTEKEAYNFKNFCETKFMRWFAVTVIQNNNASNYYNYFPWLKDYTHPWTDEDLRKHFSITDEEWKEIDETVK